jgi:hypothetical protein
MLRRWHKIENWESVSRDLHKQHLWCMQVYHEIFYLVVATYHILCVRVLDYYKILPKLEEWGQRMLSHMTISFFTDGKP